MPKSIGLEYFVIIAAMAASLSVPVFANSIVSATTSASDALSTYPQSSTVHTLGTLPANELQNSSPQPPVTQSQQTTDDDTLQPVESNGVKYMTGGIGDEERATFNSVKKDYNLHIVNAGVDGEFVGNARIVITNRQGQELVNAAAGPLFYAELPPGAYDIEARSNGQKQIRHISVTQSRPLFLHISWR